VYRATLPPVRQDQEEEEKFLVTEQAGAHPVRLLAVVYGSLMYRENRGEPGETVMASFQKHCDETEEVLGKTYAEVHLWLDEFYRTPEYGARHRRKRHHEQGIREAVRQFGEEAGVAARLHIITDLREEGWTESDRFPKDEKEYAAMGLF
jgi:hypothetical protein